ncbi:hypothetical protein OsJ_02384 [Oryza sativa Japonica Group]|uniref:Uncharacterized protein n=1 Tax=Oryza sativa subsp. japonica TaxID=39947 RepID=A2ZUU0_ORYSJ|nr:hypothetical protein OsJ_02384 [Oryza sativa Japonica Group]
MRMHRHTCGWRWPSARKFPTTYRSTITRSTRELQGNWRLDVLYKSQEYKLHYTLETKHRNRNTANSKDGIRMAAMENLSNLKPEPAASKQFEERRHRSIDVGALNYDPREQEERLMERNYTAQVQCAARGVE